MKNVSYSELTDQTNKKDVSILPSMSVSNLIKPKIINKNFRGPVPGSKYFIINEIISGENTKVFSAVRQANSGNFEDRRYCIKYYSKHWIKNEVLAKLKFPENQMKKFFEQIKNTLDDFKTITHPNIQQLIDYYDDDEGMYIVTEFCEWTLKDYITLTREPLRFSKLPFECRIRKYIVQILSTIQFLHENNSLAFGGLLNSSDIMIQEVADNNFNSVVVKLPHPFLSNLLTIVKVYNIDHFPSFYSPEVYSLFKEDEIMKIVEKKDSFDMGSLLSKLTHNFDMWAMGYLLYEILFENPPFAFDDLNKALNILVPQYYYKINPYSISYNLLKILNMCLQYDSNSRLQSFLLQEILDELKKENESGEDFDNSLKERAGAKVLGSKDELENFPISDPNFYDRFQ
mmetsp:Transcript_28679/g.29827  ORF Transcript_28679/g.29827 Transcript_28679/m.29827 type:complete len:401 (-) Transcript_28679:82-1284(-)